MQTKNFYRSRSFVSAWCITLAIVCASAIQAAEIKPFFTFKIASVNTVISIAEKVIGMVDKDGALNLAQNIAPYKNLTGVNADGIIGLALQSGEEGQLEAFLFVPITDLKAFNVPGVEMYLQMAKMALKQDGNKYTYNSPLGNYVAFQEADYLVVVPESAAELAEGADPKKLFADLEKFTAGGSVNLENTSFEAVADIVASVQMMLAAQGIELNDEEMTEQIKKLFDEVASATSGVVLDPKTLECTMTGLTIPKKGSGTEQWIAQSKEAKTIFGGFLGNSPQTIFSVSSFGPLRDEDVDAYRQAFDLITESFLEGMAEADEEEEDEGEETVAEIAEGAEKIIDSVRNIFNALLEKKFIDSGVSFDAEGTFLSACSIGSTDELQKIGKELYALLTKWDKDFDGKEVQKYIDEHLKQDYETVAEFKLSSLKIAFSEMPYLTALHEEDESFHKFLNSLTLNVFWAVKKDEAFALAIGLDAAKTEQAFKTALGKTDTPVQPKPDAMFSLKPLGEFLQKVVLPYIPEEDAAEPKEAFTVLANADPQSKAMFTAEYPDNGFLLTYHLSGELVTSFVEFCRLTGEMTAREAVRKWKENQIQDF